MNGSAYGQVAEQLAGSRFDLGLHRPFIETSPKSRRYGQRCVVVNSGRQRWDDRFKAMVPIYNKLSLQEAHNAGIQLPPVVNATALRKEEWIQLDTVVVRAARYRLRFWADISSANSFGGFNGMAKLILEHETMSDPGEAIVDMDALTPGRSDTPKFQLQGLPLPITHSDFWFSSRKLAVSRNSGTPLDTTMGEAAGRRVAEMIEKTSIGNVTGITYGGNSTQVGGYGRTSQVYGALNFPSRLVKNNINSPTAGGWTASKTLADVLAMRDALYLNKFYGPFMLYHSNDWDQYMDNDYILTGGNVATQTLRERLKAIEGIQDVRRLDFLFATAPVTNTNLSTYTGPGGESLATTAVAGVQAGGGTSATPGTPNATGGNPFTLLMVQMTPDVIRAVNGMDITTIQWESVGGLRLNFKVLCIQVPQIRADHYGNCGLLQATTS